MPGKVIAIGFGAAAALAISMPVQAKTNAGDAPPAQVQRLIACRALADAEQRLACFDRETAAVVQAVERKDIVVIDRERARAAGRSLFGFSVPNFGGLFGGGGEDEIKQVEGLVASADYARYRGWTIRLQDGSVWTQIDSTVLPLDPRRGEKVVIRRAALGSFFMKVGRQPAFRAKRTG